MVPNRLDLRRVAALAGASLAVVLLTCGNTSALAANSSEEQAPEIIHQPLSCWPAEEYVVLSADREHEDCAGNDGFVLQKTFRRPSFTSAGIATRRGTSSP